MKEYKALKAAKKWSVRKHKVVDQAAISEVKDGDDVVRAAQPERSHEELQLVQKRFDHNTGEAQDDGVRSYSLDDVARERSQIAKQISSLQDSDAGWEQFEKDLIAL